MTMTNIVIDLETTVHGGQYGKSPEAHYLNNKVVLYGWEVDGVVSTSEHGAGLFERIVAELDKGNTPRLIGHNFKFDLKYLMRERPDILWHQCEYHCTMYTEYRQTGHKSRFISLEDLCTKHNVFFKKGLDLGALLAMGVAIEDIDKGDLTTYLIEDVLATATCFARQVMSKDYEEYWQGHIVPLSAMELAGLALDTGKASSQMKALVLSCDDAEDAMFQWASKVLEWSDGAALKMDDLKYTAPRTVSYLLTGEPTSGLTKRVKRNIVWKAMAVPLLSALDIINIWGTTQPNNLGFPIAKLDIERLTQVTTGKAGQYVKDLLEYRKLNKLINTYYGPFLAEAAVTGGTIHPKMNMCTTSTGRLSSSKPNGQNMPPEARQLVVSEHGHMVELDFKQLEIIGLAHLSGDPQLIQDIKDGEDIHYNTGKRVMGWKTPADMTQAERKIVKNVNFGLIYGGGPRGLAKKTGQTEKLIKSLIQAFFTRYPRVAEWQKEFYTLVTQNLKPDGLVMGEQIYSSLIKDPVSGRKFFFKEGLAPTWVRAKTGRKYSFKPTETKNYPVQGFAGGDIVMVALTLLYAAMQENGVVEIRMTVHDSILLDTDWNISDIKFAMDKVCAELRTIYNLPFDVEYSMTAGNVYWQ